MVGIIAMKIVTHRFEDIFKKNKEIDQELYDLAHILSI